MIGIDEGCHREFRRLETVRNQKSSSRNGEMETWSSPEKRWFSVLLLTSVSSFTSSMSTAYSHQCGLEVTVSYNRQHYHHHLHHYFLETLRRRRCGTVLHAKKPGRPKDRTLVADNRPARRNYEIVEDVEVGVSLLGTEVKACRDGSMNIQDGFAQIRDGECWLKGVHIGPCPNAGAFFQHEAKRERRLLLKKREIRKFDQTMRVKKLTLVPLKAYFNRDNRLKILLGLARGKNTQDKRDDVKDREGKRDIERAMRRLR